MTKRIFDTDAYCKSFTATVVSCQPQKKKGYEIVLDRTCFYPEGGGQPGDIGTLGGAAVTDTRERSGEVIHLTDKPLEIGTTVTGEIDWEHRFDLMQNHSGEHIVSGVIHAKTGCNNVGFHMGKDTITVDLDVEITPADLLEYEKQANQAVFDDVVTEIAYPSPEELHTIPYRSKKELSGDVRIVTFPGYDICACCGTHVRRTGEIGLIKLISVQKFKDGCRIEMLCGRLALAYINRICDQNHQISVALSAKPFQTADSVLRLREENSRITSRINALENAVFAEKATALSNRGNVLLFEDSMTPDSVRKLAAAVMERCGGRCAVFSGDDQSGYKYAIGELNGDLRTLVKELNTTLRGRGGGKPFFAQGSVTAQREEIKTFFAKR